MPDGDPNWLSYESTTRPPCVSRAYIHTQTSHKEHKHVRMQYYRYVLGMYGVLQSFSLFAQSPKEGRGQGSACPMQRRACHDDH